MRRHLQEDCHHADGLASDTHADGTNRFEQQFSGIRKR